MGEPLQRYMLFSLSDQRYAIEVEAVTEISGMLTAYPIPFAPRFMRGVVNIHGKIAAVLDLALFSGKGAATKGRNLILLNRADTSLALVVEQTERIVSSEEILSREAGRDSLEKGRLLLADGTAILLAVDDLLAAIEAVLGR